MATFTYHSRTTWRVTDPKGSILFYFSKSFTVPGRAYYCEWSLIRSCRLRAKSTQSVIFLIIDFFHHWFFHCKFLLFRKYDTLSIQGSAMTSLWKSLSILERTTSSLIHNPSSDGFLLLSKWPRIRNPDQKRFANFILQAVLATPRLIYCGSNKLILTSMLWYQLINSGELRFWPYWCGSTLLLKPSGTVKPGPWERVKGLAVTWPRYERHTDQSGLWGDMNRWRIHMNGDWDILSNAIQERYWTLHQI